MNVVKYFTISHFPAKKAGLFKKKKLLLKDVGQLVFLQLYKFIIKLSPGYKITFYPLVPPSAAQTFTDPRKQASFRVCIMFFLALVGSWYAFKHHWPAFI